MNIDASLSLISRPTTADMVKILAPGLTSGTSAIDLVVTLDTDDLNLRDLSRFFVLIDRTYGRILYGDLRKYAWDEMAQLQISRVHAGSWEIVLSQILHVIPNPTPILIVYVLLRLLPKAFKESADGVLKLSTAYSNYEQARLARANRKALLAQMQRDNELRKVSTQHRKHLADVIDHLVREDPSVSNPALDFAARSLISVTIGLRTAGERRPKREQRVSYNLGSSNPRSD